MILGSWKDLVGRWGESWIVPRSGQDTNYYLFKYSTVSDIYIQTIILPVVGVGWNTEANAFEGNQLARSTYTGTNHLDLHAYLYDMSKPIDNMQNPIFFGMSGSHATATGISGNYVIGGYDSHNPIIAPTPVVSSGIRGEGGSVSKKKSAKKSSTHALFGRL